LRNKAAPRSTRGSYDPADSPGIDNARASLAALRRNHPLEASKKYLVLASVFGLTGVGLGAFGAHALKSVISSEMLSVFETGVRYQMYHTFALFVASWAFRSTQIGWFRISAQLFSAGIVLFSGSLYLLSATNAMWFGYVTPFGGLLFLAGWAVLASGFWKERRE
jgi:uncharacterized membrane protein YgdD (TMEM256/DUF423 family)